MRGPIFHRITLIFLAVFTTIFLLEVFIPGLQSITTEIFAFHTDKFLESFCVWQAVTAIFLHADLQHFLWNIVFFTIFGNFVADAWRPREFAKYFLLCGVASFLCFLVYHNIFSSKPVIGLGASGAITGLVVAYGLIFKEQQILFLYLIPMKVKHFACLVLALEVIMLWMNPFSTVSHLGHLAGGVFGYLYIKYTWKQQSKVKQLQQSRVANLEI